MNWYVAFQFDMSDPANPTEMDRVIRVEKEHHDRMKELLDMNTRPHGADSSYIWVYVEWEE